MAISLSVQRSSRKSTQLEKERLTRQHSGGRLDSPNYSFKGNQNRADFAPLNSGVRSLMKSARTLVGTAICVLSFLGLLFCAFQHGKVCSSMPTFNLATSNTVPYFCKGQRLDAFATPFQDALKNRLAPTLCLTLLIGFGIRRWGSPD